MEAPPPGQILEYAPENKDQNNIRAFSLCLCTPIFGLELGGGESFGPLLLVPIGDGDNYTLGRKTSKWKRGVNCVWWGGVMKRSQSTSKGSFKSKDIYFLIHTVVLVYINAIKTTFYFNFNLYQALQQPGQVKLFFLQETNF